MPLPLSGPLSGPLPAQLVVAPTPHPSSGSTWVVVSGTDAQEIYQLARELKCSPEEVANALLANHLLAFELDAANAALIQRHAAATGDDPHDLVRQALRRPHNSLPRRFDPARRGRLDLPWGCSIGLGPLVVLGILAGLFMCCWISYMVSLLGATFAHP